RRASSGGGQRASRSRAISGVRAILTPLAGATLTCLGSSRTAQLVCPDERGSSWPCGIIAAMPGPPARFPRIAIVGRPGTPDLATPLSELAGFLTARGHAVVLE